MQIKTSKIFNDVFLVKWDDCLFQAEEFEQTTGFKFVQENEVMNIKANTVRGMGMQLKNPQGKLIRVVKGSVYDVIVDARINSETFQQWESYILNNSEKEWLWIPPGYMHGYMTLKDGTIVQYKCTSYYCKDDEVGFRWNDPKISITWPTEGKNIIVSQRDGEYPLFCNLYK